LALAIVTQTGSLCDGQGDEKGSRCESGAGPLLCSARLSGQDCHCDGVRGKAVRESR
jgi:hypothetical protein